jgi:arsenate reductase (thioredoxin)
MADQIFNVLFICTGNSARSIMAEAILNHLGRGRFKAFSAGTHPRGALHPMTAEVLRDQGYAMDGLRSKSWAEFARPDAPRMDFVFTVCDQAAGEACPAWPGQPITGHWGFADPATVAGDRETQRRAFVHAERQIVTRIRLFLSLPFDKLDRLSLQSAVSELGKEVAERRLGKAPFDHDRAM